MRSLPSPNLATVASREISQFDRQDVVAETDALVTDVDVRARNHLLDLLGTFRTETAPNEVAIISEICHGHPPTNRPTVDPSYDPNSLKRGTYGRAEITSSIRPYSTHSSA